MNFVKLFLCALFFLLETACSSTVNAPQKLSNQEIRQKSRGAYSELDDNQFSQKYETSQATPSKKNISSTKATQYKDIPKPVIMVMPAPSGNKFSVNDVITSNPYSRATMEGIMEYLTKKGYEVKSLEGNSELDNFVQMQNDIAGTDDDQSYLASLSLNADIYIKFSGAINQEGQVIVELSAYESSTARQLGSHSSSVNSHGRTSPIDTKANLKTAAHKAMSGIESRLLSYWTEDLKNGTQYKVVMNIKGDYSDSQLEDLQENIIENLKSTFNKVKVNTVTSQTIDLVIYADQEKYEDSQSTYSEIRKTLKSIAETKKINLTKKLIIMDIK